MQFDPHTFIELARRSGLKMTQANGKVLVYANPGENLDLWSETIARHKPELLYTLPVDTRHNTTAD